MPWAWRAVAFIWLLSQTPNASAQSKSPAAPAPADQNQEIVVVAQAGDRSSIDRTTYTVRDTAEARSTNALDLLGHVPLVDVAPSGQIRLLGTAGVRILIDGKEVADTTAMLRALQGSQVAKIEVISNPSAQFSARGTGGIINIVTRRTVGPGVGGSVTASGDNFGTAELKVSPTWSRGRLSLSGSLDIAHSRGQPIESDQERYRTGADGALLLESRERTMARTHSDTLSANLIIGYKPTVKETISLTALVIAGTEGLSGSSELFFGAAPLQPFVRGSASTGSFGLLDISADYRREGRRAGETLTLSVKSSRIHGPRDSLYITTDASGAASNFQLHSDWCRSTATFKLDYVRPLGNERRLSVGGAMERTGSDVTTQAAGDATPASSAISLFSRAVGSFFEESGYVSAQSPLLGGTVLAGLRLEARQYSFAALPVGGTRFHAFPSLHLERKLTKTLTSRVSYSRRVNWPDINALDPQVRFSDPRTADAGDIALRPEITDAIEAKLNLRGSRRTVDVTAFSRRTRDVWSFLSTLGADGVLTTRRVNFGTRLLRGASVVVQGSLRRHFSYTLSGNVADERLKGNGPASPFAGAGFQYDGSAKLEYHHGRDGQRGADRITVTARYAGPRDDGFTRTGSYLAADGAWSHALTQRLAGVLKITQLTGPVVFRNTSVSTDTVSRTTYRSRDRRFTLSLTYSLDRRTSS